MDELIERYLKVPPAQRYGLAGLLLVGLVALFYFLVYQGQQEQVTALEASLQKAIAQAADKENVAQNLRTYEDRLTALQRDLDRAKALLPDAADVPQLLAQMGNIARQVGMQINTFSPRPETIADFYAEIPFDVAVSGSFHEIAMFIDQIGKLDRIINVIDLSMKSPTAVNQRVVVDGKFSVRTYRFVSEAEKKASTAAKEKKK